MSRIKKNDMVKVIAGKDKGKSGKVLRVIPADSKVIVQGVNFVKKHAKRTRQDDKGGIIHKEAPVNMSNLMVICKGCNSVTRVGADMLKDGSKVRYCKNCKEVL
ncbi:MAG: 50S ribosomal protein L24 [Candidatus Omnitrophica bacterium]|nr:50S ribosomal protein L24 [Candidatus Omnitrophota bacterium]MDD5487387.1 50S ribosomal protein L24 [Candidatus Omnitrophota bacterium]